MLAVAVILLFLAVAAAAVGMARVNVPLIAGGGAVAGAIWLGCGWLIENNDSTYRVVTLRLRAIDAASGAAVPSVATSARVEDEGSEPAAYRLPWSIIGPPAPGKPEILLVSIVVEARLSGSLIDRMRDPSAHTELVDQTIELNGAGYRPLRRTLSQLLPKGWPYAALPESPIEVLLERE